MLEILGVAGKQEQSTILHTKEPISSWKYCAYKTPVVFNNIKLEKKNSNAKAGIESTALNIQSEKNNN
jgi:hypothetical protein